MKTMWGALFLTTMLFLSCASIKETAKRDRSLSSNEQNQVFSEQTEEEEIIKPSNFTYKPSPPRLFDLLHTELKISFDWNERSVIGEAKLLLTPYFYPQSILELDAKGFEIQSLTLITSTSSHSPPYQYDNKVLQIDLEKSFTKDDTLQIALQYIARPYELSSEGSAAITDNRGLYFINHDGSIPGKPQQIWTQGETEASSCWFPTLDSPNEKCTQEMFITVEDKFQTLSNGQFLGSTQQAQGTRTDHWKQNLPHSPYLFMLAVGEFAVIRDEWRGKEVNYYVEKDFKTTARLTFGNTPEMLEFYSNILNYEFPWDKYSQIVVRDFVSGAMENTSATVHYSKLNQEKGDFIDGHMDGIISHELFHHWFGDLVTCESWPNLTLNEGFATYGEYLWNEYKYGKPEADRHLLEDRNTYLNSSLSTREPLIRYHVRNGDDMFDTHSYQKGGATLHMLRNYVGDQAFFEALHRYLEKYAFQTVEVHQLRLVFEEVTGKDLNWFFDQWFLAPGHPELRVSYLYDSHSQLLKISVNQLQETQFTPTYQLPVQTSILLEGEFLSFNTHLLTRDTIFIIPLKREPDLVVFDADKVLICEMTEKNKSTTAWIHQLTDGQNYIQVAEAIDYLRNEINEAEVADALLKKASDPYWGIRELCLDALSECQSCGKDYEIATLALRNLTTDPYPQVRATSLEMVRNSNPDIWNADGDSTLFATLIASLLQATQDSSNKVKSNALLVLNQYAPDKALEIAKNMSENPPKKAISSISIILLEAEDAGVFDFVETHLISVKSAFDRLMILGLLADYGTRKPQKYLSKTVELLKRNIELENIWWVRMGIARLLGSFSEEDPTIKTFFKRKSVEEKNENLKLFYEENAG